LREEKSGQLCAVEIGLYEFYRFWWNWEQNSGVQLMLLKREYNLA
jgi:hypothetical protein